MVSVSKTPASRALMHCRYKDEWPEFQSLMVYCRNKYPVTKTPAVYLYRYKDEWPDFFVTQYPVTKTPASRDQILYSTL